MTDTEKRAPDADALGHCTVCGKLADHVHHERIEVGPKSHVELAAQVQAEERNAARRARAAEERAAEDQPSDDDLVIDVELDPKLIEAAKAAQDAEKQDEGEAHKAQVAQERAEPEPQDPTRVVPKAPVRATPARADKPKAGK